MYLLGRVFISLGTESLDVAQSCWLFKWYADQNISMYIALARTVSKLLSAIFTGVILPLYVDGRLWGIKGATVPNFLGAMICLFCFLCGTALVIMDKISDDWESDKSKIKDIDSSEKVEFSHIKKFSNIVWIVSINIAFAYGSYEPFMKNS